MKCVFCAGPVKKKQVEEEIKMGDDHLMVPIQAEVCENCHERYYPSGSVDYLSKLKKELKNCKNSSYKQVGKVYTLISDTLT